MNSEVTEWLALHRAHEGSVTKLSTDYFKAGRPVADFLVVAFECLIGSGLLALGRPDPLGWQRVCVTHSGQTRYTELRSIAVRTGMVTDEPG
ncbi:MAG: hypothetical protein ACT4NY_12065 [Pseudonocardiales bacterium]